MMTDVLKIVLSGDGHAGRNALFHALLDSKRAHVQLLARSMAVFHAPLQKELEHAIPRFVQSIA